MPLAGENKGHFLISLVLVGMFWTEAEAET